MDIDMDMDMGMDMNTDMDMWTHAHGKWYSKISSLRNRLLGIRRRFWCEFFVQY